MKRILLKNVTKPLIITGLLAGSLASPLSTKAAETSPIKTSNSISSYTTSEIPDPRTIGGTVSDLSEETIQKADPYIKLNGFRFEITDNTALQQVLTIDEYASVSAELSQMNTDINQELLDEETPTYQVFTPTENTISFYNSALEADPVFEEQAKATKGVTKVVSHWWGWNIYLNDSDTKALRNIAIGGGTLSAISVKLAPILPGPGAIVALIAEIITISAGGLTALLIENNEGKGVILRLNKTFITPFPALTWVKPQ
ncbi:hypothetical protein ACFWM3_17960 [Gottfriedia sp. NPDC058432]|uniref:hypothetical protein n=1 Tax=Gottfriedia sp. NPDC058432 TaxID=3346497 RepID=UPI00364D481C